MNIIKKLIKWQDAGLISEDTHQNILTFENQQSTIPWLKYSLFSLAFLIIAIGIISIIAANWEYTSSTIKLLSNFSLLIIIGYLCIYTYQKDKTLWFEVLLIFFIALCLASIGLISQIYHTSGKLYQALTLWLITTLPFSLFSHKIILPHIFSIGLLITITNYLLASNYSKEVFTMLAFSMPFLFGIIGNLFYFFKKRNFTQPSYIWQSVFFISTTAIINFTIYSPINKDTTINAVLILIISMLVYLLSIFLQSQLKVKIKILITIISFIFSASCLLSLQDIRSPLIGASLLLLNWSALAILFIALNKQKLFQVTLTLIGIRFLVIYFEIIGDLTSTGIGLILSGLFIILATTIWYKYHVRVNLWIEKKIQSYL